MAPASRAYAWVRGSRLAGTEEISGIASQCSCPERETQCNPNIVHVFER